jgi:protocatechuate 3,4-dioxygenase, alpha subunit
VTRLVLTGSQTVGPFFHDCLMRDDARCDVLAPPASEAPRIRVEGRVIDGDGAPVIDAILEVWQANQHGRYNHPLDRRDLPLDSAFAGYGRIATDADGAYCFTTIRPGAVPFDDERAQAPHIGVAVLGRGLLNHLYTRIYFDDEPANAGDPVLERVPPNRRATLIAARQKRDEAGDAVYRFDVVLQGAGETVFFDWSTTAAGSSFGRIHP